MAMKTEMTNTGQQPMMSSREIAELTGKDVNKVHRDIRAMVPALYSVDSGDDVKSYAWGTSKSEMNAFLVHHNIQGVKPNYDDRGYVYEFLLDRRHTEILVSGYDIKRRAAIIDRWHALESGEAQPRIAAQPAPQAINMHSEILSLARVVAEATASATMKAVMDVMDARVIPEPELPQHQSIPPASAPERPRGKPEYALVTALVWAYGLSDPSCRRLVSFYDLPTTFTNGDRGHLLIHRPSFAGAVISLIEEAMPPSAKRKRWKHPEFGCFDLKITEANKSAVEAKQ